ncbi:retrovirus-related Pol polyprotein from transposon 412 [Trichonephila clavipes]|nr:retrovirus-related Pol polyprotein from transposon 412 [Trichonephila clavipes]
MLDTLAGNIWFSTLDLKSGYMQVELHPDDKEKTAFTTGQGLLQFKVMPFGLKCTYNIRAPYGNSPRKTFVRGQYIFFGDHVDEFGTFWILLEICGEFH